MVREDPAKEDQRAPDGSGKIDCKPRATRCRVASGRVGPEAEADEGRDHDDADQKNPEAAAVVAPPAGKNGLIRPGRVRRDHEPVLPSDLERLRIPDDRSR